MRYRITVRGTDIELRGYIDGDATLLLASRALDGIGIVVASPAEDDYNPFSGAATAETSLAQILSMLSQQEYPNLPDLIRMMAEVHYMQANVIQGERALRESAEAELRDRELHHFEVEQENERLKAQPIHPPGSVQRGTGES